MFLYFSLYRYLFVYFAHLKKGLTRSGFMQPRLALKTGFFCLSIPSYWDYNMPPCTIPCMTSWGFGCYCFLFVLKIEHRALHKLCECFILLGCSFLNGYILKHSAFYLFLNSLIYVNNIS